MATYLKWGKQRLYSYTNDEGLTFAPRKGQKAESFGLKAKAKGERRRFIAFIVQLSSFYSSLLLAFGFQPFAFSITNNRNKQLCIVLIPAVN